MRQRQIPLATNTAEQDTSGNELLVNWYPQITQGEKYAFSIVGAPGQAFYAELPTLPLSALYEFNRRQFAITPGLLFSEGNTGFGVEFAYINR